MKEGRFARFRCGAAEGAASAAEEEEAREEERGGSGEGWRAETKALEPEDTAPR